MGGGIPGVIGDRRKDLSDGRPAQCRRQQELALRRRPAELPYAGTLAAPADRAHERSCETLLDQIHQRFESIRKEHGDGAVAALGSATNTNEALFLMKKYFQGRVDFRLGNETRDLSAAAGRPAAPRRQASQHAGRSRSRACRRSRMACRASSSWRRASRSARCGFHFIRNWLATMRRISLGKLQQLDSRARILRGQHDARIRMGRRRDGASADGGVGRRDGNVHQLRRTRSDCEPRRCARRAKRCRCTR